MTQPVFSEVIKVLDGRFCALPLHLDRVARTSHHFYGRETAITLDAGMIPEELRSGLVKCRLTYSDNLITMDFTPYSFRGIRTLGIAECPYIDYRFKYADRSTLDKLLAASGRDEILITRNGMVADTTFSNVVFEDSAGDLYTPEDYLLAGTKRQALIKNNIIKTRGISVKDISSYRRIFLINAMIDLEDMVAVNTCDIDLTQTVGLDDTDY